MDEFAPNLISLSVTPSRSTKFDEPWNVVLRKVVQPVGDTGRPTWLCPELESLEITANDPISLDLPAILKLVRIRNADIKSNGKQVIKSPISSIHITLQTGRLSPGQVDLLDELKSEVHEVQYVVPPERNKVQNVSRRVFPSDFDDQSSILSSFPHYYDSDWSVSPL